MLRRTVALQRNCALAEAEGLYREILALKPRHFDALRRWLLERADTPWCPRARLFRQPAPGDWGTVMLAAREALCAWAASAPASR
jgi:hypothetical protein